MICFIQNHVTADHLRQTAWGAEISQKFGQIIYRVVLFIRPVEHTALIYLFIAVCKISCILAVAHYEQLGIFEQTSEVVSPIPFNLVERLFDRYTAAF